MKVGMFLGTKRNIPLLEVNKLQRFVPMPGMSVPDIWEWLFQYLGAVVPDIGILERGYWEQGMGGIEIKLGHFCTFLTYQCIFSQTYLLLLHVVSTFIERNGDNRTENYRHRPDSEG